MSEAAVLAEILRNEGGFQDEPQDVGNIVDGKVIGTNFGITPQVLAEWRGVPASSITKDDMKKMKKQEASDIYRKRYIAPFDWISDTRLRENVIDMGVNSGVGRATKLLQELAGAKADGVAGPNTQRAVGNAGLSTNDYSDARIGYYNMLGKAKPQTYGRYVKGWTNRANRYRSK